MNGNAESSKNSFEVYKIALQKLITRQDQTTSFIHLHLKTWNEELLNQPLGM